jgi:hypothetical protein
MQITSRILRNYPAVIMEVFEGKVAAAIQPDGRGEGLGQAPGYGALWVESCW